MKLGFVIPNNWGLEDPLAVVDFGKRVSDSAAIEAWAEAGADELIIGTRDCRPAGDR